RDKSGDGQQADHRRGSQDAGSGGRSADRSAQPPRVKLVVLSSHGILEYDDLRLFSGLGYDVFMPGGYSDPSHPGETLRPALDVPGHPELVALCHEQRVKHEGQPTDFGVVDWAKADLHPD